MIQWCQVTAVWGHLAEGLTCVTLVTVLFSIKSGSCCTPELPLGSSNGIYAISGAHGHKSDIRSARRHSTSINHCQPSPDAKDPSCCHWLIKFANLQTLPYRRLLCFVFFFLEFFAAPCWGSLMLSKMVSLFLFSLMFKVKDCSTQHHLREWLWHFYSGFNVLFLWNLEWGQIRKCREKFFPFTFTWQPYIR